MGKDDVPQLCFKPVYEITIRREVHTQRPVHSHHAAETQGANP